MAKSFKLKANPTFKAPVEIPVVGEDPMRVTFTFKSMNRRELARTFDSWKEQGMQLLADMKQDAEDGNPWSLEQLADREIKMQASQLKDIVSGWGFSDPFNDENIEELAEMAVSITEAIVDQYHEAYQRARKGN